MNSWKITSFKAFHLLDNMDFLSDSHTPSELGKLLASQNSLVTYAVSMGKDNLGRDLKDINQMIDQITKLGSLSKGNNVKIYILYYSYFHGLNRGICL